MAAGPPAMMRAPAVTPSFADPLEGTAPPRGFSVAGSELRVKGQGSRVHGSRLRASSALAVLSLSPSLPLSLSPSLPLVPPSPSSPSHPNGIVRECDMRAAAGRASFCQRNDLQGHHPHAR
eukprot:174216-Rhodomonas_salina.1